MTGLVNSPIAGYAVIEAGRTEGPSERFVIAYSDEESLRELIPGPALSRVLSPPVKRLKSTSTVTSGRPPLGSKFQETELRNINAEFFTQSRA
jgi:hypothetical protein